MSQGNLIGGATAAATGLSGLAKITMMIPDNIGNLACLVGIFASLGVIIFGSIRTWLAYRMDKFDMEMRRKEFEAKNIERRKETP